MNRNYLKDIDRKYSKSIDMKELNRNISWKTDSARNHKIEASRYSHEKARERCPICNNNNYEVFVNVYGYDYLECKNCGHIFLKNTISEIEGLYEDDKKSLYLNDDLFNKRVDKIAYPKVEWIFEKTLKEGYWIDIGCGTGEVLLAAKRLGYKVKGIDANKEHVKFAKNKGINVSCDYLNEKNIAGYLKGANIISLFNILEHIEDPKEIISNIGNNIDEGGYVVIEVPRHPSISSLSNLVFNDNVSRHIYPPAHMHIFTEKSISIAIENGGLKPVSIWTFGQDIHEFFMTSFGVADIKETKFINQILDSVPALQKSVDESGLSDTMIVICKKE